MTKIKVAIVDDEMLFIEGLKMILGLDEQLEVVHTASNGRMLMDIVKSDAFEADVILLDLSMPEMDGVATLDALNKSDCSAKVIILTSHYNDGIIIKLLDEGASGFLAKNEDPNEVIKTIINVGQKGFHINDYIIQLIRSRRILAKNKEAREALSNRELDVLRLICKELTNKEIASELYLSPRTVEGHRNRILEKTGSKNTVGIVIYAIENNLIDVDTSKFG